MAPTKSRYTYEVEGEDRIITREKAFGGKDYLSLWASDNGMEVLELERMEREGAQAVKDTTPEAPTAAETEPREPSESR